MKKRVLCLMTDGFEEVEMVTPVNLLRRAGVEVTIASLHGGDATGKCGIVVRPDAALADLRQEDFDLLLIPGGPGVGELRKDGRAAELAAGFHAAGKPVAAICAAPLILSDAGLLRGKRYTAHFSVRGELGRVLNERVVEDGLIITSRGAGTAVDFGISLVRRLAGDDAAVTVAEAIMA
jgi:4-methyl-5(b-hydroxyethyl)-thiazole monophosphate biosynthesis